MGRISRASATQRAGRAGRTAPGRCVRLWSQREERGLAEFDVPEIHRADLSSTVLALHAWGHADPARFGWFETPAPEAIASAERTLTMLQALDPQTHTITALGRDLLALPVHPRLGRLLVGAAEVGQPRAGATLAALLSEQDLLATRVGAPGEIRPRTPSRHGDSDLLDRLDLLEEAERSRFAPTLRAQGLDPHAARRVAQTREELLRQVRRWCPRIVAPGVPALPLTKGELEGVRGVAESDRKNPPQSPLSKGGGRRNGDPGEEDLLRLLLLAYPDRVARRRAGDASAGVMVGGRGVRLDPQSVVRAAEFFLAIDLNDERRAGTREARVRIASAIDPVWLEEFFPEAMRRTKEVRYDAERDRVASVVTDWYRDLLVKEDPHGAVAAPEAGQVLAHALHDRAEAVIREDPAAAAWLDRLACLRLAAGPRSARFPG